MNKRPLMALTSIMLVALGTVGIGYALWFELLTIDGTVETGNVDGTWSFASCRDFELKEVGSIEVPESDPLTGEIPAGTDSIRFLISNGYPSYTADCQLEYTYTGSVPAHVEEIRFTAGDLTGCVVDQGATTGSFVAACDQATVTWANGLCTQLHENDFLGSSLRVHVEQPAAQNTTYTFGVEVQLNQFNESDCP